MSLGDNIILFDPFALSSHRLASYRIMFTVPYLEFQFAAAVSRHLRRMNA